MTQASICCQQDCLGGNLIAGVDATEYWMVKVANTHTQLAKQVMIRDFHRQCPGICRNAVQAVLPSFETQKYGKVINVGTNLVYNPVVTYYDYSAAKAALVSLTRNLAAELGPLGVRVNLVAGGLLERTEAALAAGVHEERIIWDPGLGFAKTTEQNLQLLKGLDRLSPEGVPLLVGPSRKRFIGTVLNEPKPKARIWGTAAVACRCSQAGIAVLRVHDVGPMQQILRMAATLWSWPEPRD